MLQTATYAILILFVLNVLNIMLLTVWLKRAVVLALYPIVKNAEKTHNCALSALMVMLSIIGQINVRCQQ